MKKNISKTLLALALVFLVTNTYAGPFDEDEDIVATKDNTVKEETEKPTTAKVSILSTISSKVKEGISAVKNAKDKVVDNASSQAADTEKTEKSTNKSNKKSFITESIFLPGHESKEMVCQGIAYLPSKVMDANEQGDGSYCQYVLLSYYPKESKQPSQILVVDRKTAKPVKRFSLYKKNGDAYTGHAGGIAVAGEYLWVASGYKIHGFSVKEIIDFIGDTKKEAKAVKGLPKSMDELPAKKLTCIESYGVDSKASYVSFDGKYLWVGDFTKKSSKDYQPIAHHNAFKRNCWVAGYLVDQKGLPTSNTSYSLSIGDDTYKVNKPDAIIAMRESVQGMAVCGDYVALTISFGATNSKLAVYKNPLKDNGTKFTYKPAGQSKSFTVNSWELADKKNWLNTKTIAAGAEDLEYDGDNLYLTFECSSKNYNTKWRLANPLIKMTKDFYLIDVEKIASEK